jgi:TM2 domain-containing membrane protein YozV
VTTPPYGHDPYALPPSYGQPSYGQPSYGQPSSGQPSYGQPDYGQQPQPPYSVSGPPQPYSQYPVSGAPQPYSPYPSGYVVPTGYGPQYSDKSKLAAGLLQLLLGFFLGLGGVGRLYAGNTSLGIVQIVASVVGWVSFWCGFFLILPFLVFFGVWLWFVIDGIIMLAGQPTDGQGRPLRP